MADKLTNMRIQWLLNNPACWEPYDIKNARQEQFRILFQMLQQAGLYSQTTAPYDTALDRLVARAREIRARQVLL